MSQFLESRPLLSWMEIFVARMRNRTTDASPSSLAGHRGEDAAFFYLTRQGLAVVARRWRAPHFPGEVDIIAWDGDVLCFVEVKTRSHRDTVSAEFAIDHDKVRALQRMAKTYIRLLQRGADDVEPKVRFDVIMVYLDETPSGIAHMRGAF